MTLFTTLLVLIAERLFKLGEHWQLDHRLEVVFRRIKHFSLLGTLLMTVVAVAVVYLIQRLLQGQLFNVPLLVFWILLGLLCIGPVDRFYETPLLIQQQWRQARPVPALFTENNWAPSWNTDTSATTEQPLHS